MNITIKSENEIVSMREGGKILASIMEKLSREVFPGQNTLELDKLAEKLVFANGGTPVFKGYGAETGNPFPATICASLNDEIVHGVPLKKKILREGDILKIDIGMKYQGLITDMARTFPVGRISKESARIMDVTKESLDLGISRLKEGNFLSDYSQVVGEFVEAQGFFVVQDLVGHGVGYRLHEDPQILNYWPDKKKFLKLRAGMTLALEPMVNAGTFRIRLKKDGWTYATRDGSLSAHFEDTVLVTEDGAEILTR